MLADEVGKVLAERVENDLDKMKREKIEQNKKGAENYHTPVKLSEEEG